VRSAFRLAVAQGRGLRAQGVFPSLGATGRCKKKPQGGNYKLFSIFSLQTEAAPGVFSDVEIVIWSLEIII
jgi:hypothetical protein